MCQIQRPWASRRNFWHELNAIRCGQKRYSSCQCRCHPRVKTHNWHDATRHRTWGRSITAAIELRSRLSNFLLAWSKELAYRIDTKSDRVQLSNKYRYSKSVKKPIGTWRKSTFYYIVDISLKGNFFFSKIRIQIFFKNFTSDGNRNNSAWK